MKAIIIFIITSVLIFAFGCNYDYGEYGKDKKDSNTEQTSKEGTAAN